MKLLTSKSLDNPQRRYLKWIPYKDLGQRALRYLNQLWGPYFGVKLPQWIRDPSYLPNLVNLELVQCRKCEQLVGFGKLPTLKILHLFDMDGIKCLYNDFVGGGETAQSVLFPSLKELVLKDMGALEEWVDIPTISCFPCLEEIYISNCPNLRITPTTHFPSLKELVLHEINGRLVEPLIIANLPLDTVELEKISELKFLPPGWLLQLQGNIISALRVVDCLDFQGFRRSKEDQNEEEEEGFTSIEFLALLRLPALKFLPDIRSLTSLEELYIEDCESLKPLPKDLTCLPSSLEDLQIVQIQNVKEVDDFIWKK